MDGFVHADPEQMRVCLPELTLCLREIKLRTYRQRHETNGEVKERSRPHAGGGLQTDWIKGGRSQVDTALKRAAPRAPGAG